MPSVQHRRREATVATELRERRPDREHRVSRSQYNLVLEVSGIGSEVKKEPTGVLAMHTRVCLDPTAVIGGRVLGSGAPSTTRRGAGDWLVAEADESDGSFLRLAPVIGVITNIDPEHLDHYGSEDALHQAFVDFANRIPFWGTTVLCLDHPGVQPDPAGKL